MGKRKKFHSKIDQVMILQIFQKNIRKISKKSDLIFFWNLIFQNAIKWSKFNLNNWFAYPQTPHKNLNIMEKCVFDLTSTGMCIGENVFSTLGAITPKGTWNIFGPFFKISLNLLTPVSIALSGVFTFWPLLDQCAMYVG